jgi:hypothetical protein
MYTKEATLSSHVLVKTPFPAAHFQQAESSSSAFESQHVYFLISSECVRDVSYNTHAEHTVCETGCKCM